AVACVLPGPGPELVVAVRFAVGATVDALGAVAFEELGPGDVRSESVTGTRVAGVRRDVASGCDSGERFQELEEPVGCGGDGEAVVGVVCELPHVGAAVGVDGGGCDDLAAFGAEVEAGA